MTVEQRERRQLQEALVASIGADRTDTLMGYLPPTGWADVATKHDLDHLATELRAEMAALGAGLHGEMGSLQGGLRAELHESLRVQLYWMVGLVVTLVAAQFALFIALARLG